MTQPTADLACAACGGALLRYGTRDKWRCTRCAGALVGVEELGVELGMVGGDTVARAPRESVLLEKEVACPACKKPMDRLVLARVAIDRCKLDGLVWFDRGELGRVRDALGETPWARAMLEQAWD